MPRLTNSVTGVVVNVDDDTAARLNSEWKAEDEKTAPAKKAPAKKAASSSGTNK